MPQKIGCPHCQKPMLIPDNAAGKNVRCPACQKPFTIPGAVPEPVGAGVSGAATARGAITQPVTAPPSKPSISLPGSSATVCPSCGSQLLPGAVACMDCGFLLQGDGATQEQEGPPNLCTNPACGVANPPGERNCQRCSTPLPVAAGTLIHGRYRLDKLLAMGGFG
ncbi:MAG TPA: hypothetical protein VEL76_02355, partial [Gemmataceae bacterium]|nr:hypothetical protein [Gemmataceae bacterium]